MITISAYIFGALACLAAQGAIFFLTLTVAAVVAAVRTNQVSKESSNALTVIESKDMPNNRHN